MKKIFLIIPIIVAISLLATPYIIYADSFVMYQNSDAMYPTLFPDDLLIIEKSEINVFRFGNKIFWNRNNFF